MKKYLNLLLLVLGLLTTAACSRDDHQHGAGDTQYTCPMHPQIVQDEPGTCPICHMDLVPKTGHSEAMTITQDLAFLLKPTNNTVVANIATTRPEQKSIPVIVNLEGIITYDPRQVYSVAARISGRIERLYVQYNFQPIRKGQKLLEIYSPELVTAQQELLYLAQSAPEDVQLREAAKQKLRLLGATNAQISQLLRSGKALYSFPIYSPYDGYVTGLNTTAPAATPAATGTAPVAGGDAMAAMEGGGATGMGAATTASAAPMAASQDIQLREGMYVRTGQPLLRLVNPQQLWAEFKAPARAIGLLRKGTPVQISFPQLPGTEVQGAVNFLQPFFQQGQDFATIRVYLSGSQKGVMAGQLVNARASVPSEQALWLPREAVLDLGTRSVAFRKAGGVFEPVAVTTGLTAANQIQVLSGLQPDALVAVDARFLVDSESFIRVSK